MLKIHLRDKKVPKTAIHYILGLQPWQLTDDPRQVTCGMCRRMMKRLQRHLEKKGKSGEGNNETG